MRRTSSGAAGARVSALARLLEVETRLEDALEQARRDADAVREAARARAAARQGALAAELAAADAELSATLARDADAQIASERAELARRSARYEALDDRAVEALAEWVAGEALAGEGPEGAP